MSSPVGAPLASLLGCAMSSLSGSSHSRSGSRSSSASSSRSGSPVKASTKETRSWVKHCFWSLEELQAATHRPYDHRGYRFCKTCNPDPGIIPRDYARVSQSYMEGKFVYIDRRGRASPGSMSRHVISKHEHLVPAEVLRRNATCGDEPFNAARTDRFVQEIVIADLQSLSASDPGRLKRQWKNSGVGGRTECTAAFEKNYQDVITHIGNQLENARRSGATFSMSGDSWKIRGKKKRHYHAIFLHWMDEDLARHRCCIGAIEVKVKRDWAQYKKDADVLMNRFNLQDTDITAVVADHDASLRKAFSQLGYGNKLVRCGCHLVHHIVRRVIPPVRKRKRTERDRSVSGSTTSSERSSASDETSRSDQMDKRVAARMKRPALAQSDPLRHELNTLLDPFFQKHREVLKYFAQHPGKYNEMIKACAPNSKITVETLKSERDTCLKGADCHISRLMADLRVIQPTPSVGQPTF